MEKIKILVIIGPTASGKSDLAVRLAKKFNGEVISADSRQVYRGLDVGTGKITKKEMLGVPHHLLDVADPKKQFSAFQYQELGLEALKNILGKERLPIVVGGTGLYIDALTETISFPDVPPNQTLRKKLEKRGAEELFKILKKKDFKRATAIDQHNKVRLIRALEIVEVLGHVPTRQPRMSTNFIYIGLKPDNLYERIYERLLKRLEPMIREAKKLIKLKAISYQRMYELGLQYRYIAMYLQNKINKREMVEKLNIAIRQYAKRQMTWFKRNKKIKWFKPERYKEIEKFVREKI